jgi:hypothetical protein
MPHSYRLLSAMFALVTLLFALPAHQPAAPLIFAAPAALGTQAVPVAATSLNFVPGPPALDSPAPYIVPLSSAGGGTATITVTNVAIDYLTNLALNVAPGAPLTLTLDYEIRDVACPGCIDQILVGYAPNQAQTCVYDSIPGAEGASGTAEVVLTAPITAGLHFIRYDQGQDFGCNLNWWNINEPPGPNNTIAALYVRPNTNADADDLAVGDIDGDGYNDIFLGGNTANVERLLLNNDGTFRPSGVILSGPAPAQVALGDADGDGDLDLFTYADSDGSFRWYEQVPGETTWPVHLIEGSATGVSELLASDLTGDGRVDLLFGSANDAVRIGVFVNDGTPTDGAWPLTTIQSAGGLGGVTSLALGDLDGDSDSDLLAGALLTSNNGGTYRLQRFINNGGTWQRNALLGDGPAFNDLQLADLDGDGDRDLLTARSNGGQVWLNPGTGALTSTSQLLGSNAAYSAALADLDGDGDLDGALGGDPKTTLWLNNGSGLFSADGELTSNDLVSDLALADLDNDTDPDLVTVDGGPPQSWINSGGNTDAAGAQPIGTGSVISSTITVGDLAGWYRITVPEADSTLVISLTNLTEDYNLYLFAPPINEETGQLRDLGRASALGDLDDLGRASALGDLTDLGQLGNLGDLADLGVLDDLGRASALGNLDDLGRASALGGEATRGNLVAASARAGVADEFLTLNVRELAGTYSIAVVRPAASEGGAPYQLQTAILPPTEEAEPIYAPLFTDFTRPLTDTAIQTLVLYNPAQLARLYPQEAVDQLAANLADLAAHPQVGGQLIDLNAYQPLADAYALWNRRPYNHLAANFVASQIKTLLYTIAPAYPNLRYIVLVGNDEVIPHRRIRDDALFANERLYAEAAGSTRAAAALEKRYFLSDDYYAGLLPLPWRGRELYLPQFALGRLVETPAEMSGAIEQFITKPTLTPNNALVTGYTFVQDQAQAVSASLAAQGIPTIDKLINDTWTAADLRAKLYPAGPAPGLISLNSHFEHHRLFPNDANFVYADETPGQADFAGTLIFSVGCHSGLNAPDEATYADARQASDWAQAFLREGATYIGNTGFGYGDSDLIAYSERLMSYFVEELGYAGEGTPSVGRALLRAKQRYFNSLAAGTLSNYDEKIMGIATLYGLPMLNVQMPNPTTEPPGGRSLAVAQAPRLQANGITSTTINLNLNYTTTNGPLGRYDQITGEDDLQVVAGRPILPRTSRDISLEGSLAHGVLLTGAEFSDTPNFDPLIARVVTDELRLEPEPTFATEAWFPSQIASLNRFISLEGETRERLVVVPAQFIATTMTTPTLGVQRRYNSLEMVVYHAPFANTDFVAPTIVSISNTPTTKGVSVTVALSESTGLIQRVTLLYRSTSSNRWQPLELRYNGATGEASGAIPGNGKFEFIVQAADGAGNVASALDSGRPFAVTSLPPEPDNRRYIYAPMIVR